MHHDPTVYYLMGLYVPVPSWFQTFMLPDILPSQFGSCMGQTYIKMPCLLCRDQFAGNGTTCLPQVR